MDDLWPESVGWCDLTLDTPAENLALDEALLQQVDADPSLGILRTWEPASSFVVLGRSNQVEAEVDEPRCRSEGVPIFRRSSGGGAVVVGPGCLAYAVILPLNPALRTAGVSEVTLAVMEVIASGLRIDAPGITVCGTSDLVLQDRKFSGNSQRWLKNAFLHHGTILYDFDVSRIGQLLRMPTRQPDYRSHRPHGDFVTNLLLPRDQLIARLVAAWNGKRQDCELRTLESASRLANSRYSLSQWNYER